MQNVLVRRGASTVRAPREARSTRTLRLPQRSVPRSTLRRVGYGRPFAAGALGERWRRGAGGRNRPRAVATVRRKARARPPRRAFALPSAGLCSSVPLDEAPTHEGKSATADGRILCMRLLSARASV